MLIAPDLKYVSLPTSKYLDSPLIYLVSIFETPFITVQSTGIASPGFIWIRSPTFNSLASTETILLLLKRFALLS